MGNENWNRAHLAVGRRARSILVDEVRGLRHLGEKVVPEVRSERSFALCGTTACTWASRQHYQRWEQADRNCDRTPNGTRSPRLVGGPMSAERKFVTTVGKRCPGNCTGVLYQGRGQRTVAQRKSANQAHCFSEVEILRKSSRNYYMMRDTTQRMCLSSSCSHF